MPEQRHAHKNPTECMSLYPAKISFQSLQWKDRPIVELIEMS